MALSDMVHGLYDKYRLTAAAVVASAMISFNADAQVLHGNNLRDGQNAPDIRDSTVLFANGVPQLKSVKYSGLDGKVEYTDADWTSTYVKQINNQIPNGYKLDQNYPNPFNPETIQRFSIPERTQVNITVYDILGRRVKEIINKEYAPGTYETNINLEGLANGIYFINMHTKNISKTNKALLLYGSQHAKTANIPTENNQENTQTGNTQNKQTLAKTSAVDEARIFPSGDHFYAPDSIVIPITGNDNFTINGETGNDITILLYDALNFDTNDSLISGGEIIADNKTRYTNNGQAIFTLQKEEQILPFKSTKQAYWEATNYKHIPNKDTTIILAAILKDAIPGKLNIDSNHMIYTDTLTHRYWSGMNYSAASWIADTLNLCMAYRDSLGNIRALNPNNTNNPKEASIDRITKQQLELVNRKGSTLNRRFGFVKKINYIYDTSFVKNDYEAFEKYGIGLVILDQLPASHNMNVGHAIDLQTMTVKNFSIQVNAYTDTLDWQPNMHESFYYGISKELLKGFTGTYDADYINGVLVTNKSIWGSNPDTTLWNLDNPQDIAIIRFLGSIYDGDLTGCGFGNSTTEKWVTGFEQIIIRDKDLDKWRP